MNFDAQGTKDLLLAIAGLVTVVVGLYCLVRAKNGEVREAGAIFGITLIACLVIAIGSHLKEVGDWLFNVIF